MVEMWPEAVFMWLDGLKAAHKVWRDKAAGSNAARYKAFKQYATAHGLPQHHGEPVPGFDFFKAKLIVSRPVHDWRTVTVRNSGEYGDRVFKKKLDDGSFIDVALSSARAGSVWRWCSLRR